jgi:lysophospholipase L1-like esterase
MMGKGRALVLGAVAITALAAGAGLQGWQDHRTSTRLNVYLRKKHWALTRQAAVAPAGGVLLIGDSISEQAWVPMLCGKPVLNAGVSAARARDMIGLAHDLATRLKPSIAIVAIGTNDAGWGRTPADRFEQDYRALAAPLSPARLIFVGIPPVEPGKINSTSVDPAARLADNAVIQRLAQTQGATFAYPAVMPTEEGIHPTPEGTRMWVATIERACPPPR